MGDAWAVKVSCLAVRRTSAKAPQPLLAIGTNSGNIDFFDIGGPKIPGKPTCSIGNLTTCVAGLHFHHQGELLAGFSKQKKDQRKLIHAATATVFQNWPISSGDHSHGTPLNMVSALDFSRKGGLLAIGNE